MIKNANMILLFEFWTYWNVYPVYLYVEDKKIILT